ncbi:MAG: CDP-alcohol phosphatidyltransferase family protein, partial [Bacteroidota bacterium]
MDLTKWLTGNALGMTLALFLTLLTKAIFWLPLAATLSFSHLFYRFLSNSKNIFTYANLVTLSRFLVSTYAVLFFTALLPLYAFSLFGLAIALDGLDGYLARKYQQSSALGATFDMTTDAFLVLVLSFLLYQHYA